METLTYNEYLLGKLLEIKNKEFAGLEYDLQFSNIKIIYKDFEASKYNDAYIDLHECMLNYLHTTEIKIN